MANLNFNIKEFIQIALAFWLFGAAIFLAVSLGTLENPQAFISHNIDLITLDERA